MPFYVVNVLGGFHAPDLGRTLLDDGSVAEFSAEAVEASPSLSAAVRARRLVETDRFGAPLRPAPPQPPGFMESALPEFGESDTEEEAELERMALDAEMARVNEEELRRHGI